MSNPKITVIVAEAPMCLLHAWPLLMRLRQKFQIKIVYLTRPKDDANNQEMTKVFEHTGIALEFIEMEYNNEDEENFDISFDRDDATDLIKKACEGSDILLTHNHLGEWGHVYHVFVNSVVSEIDIPKIYFGYKDDNDNNLIIRPKDYGHLQIPIAPLQWNKGWIETTTPTGKYCCDTNAKEILKSITSGLNFDLTGE